LTGTIAEKKEKNYGPDNTLDRNRLSKKKKYK
jgi:hypothetical protein